MYLVVVLGLCGLEFLIVKLETLLMQMQYMPKVPEEGKSAEVPTVIAQTAVTGEAAKANNGEQIMDDSFEEVDRAKRNLTINSDEED